MSGITVTEKEINQTYKQVKAKQENVPEMTAKIKKQIKQQLLRQKQNQFITEHINKLKEKAEINKNI